MSTGTGSTGGSGAGYRVEVDNLRAFASQVRGLLQEFQAGADGARVHGASGVRSDAFGTFAEAEALHGKYEAMRDALRQVLDAIHAAIDEAQHKADMTASNYEEQENETSRALKVGDDGWSVGATTGASASYGTTGAVGTVGAVRAPITRAATRPSSAPAPAAPAPASTPAPAAGDAQPTW